MEDIADLPALVSMSLDKFALRYSLCFQYLFIVASEAEVLLMCLPRSLEVKVSKAIVDNLAENIIFDVVERAVSTGRITVDMRPFLQCLKLLVRLRLLCTTTLLAAEPSPRHPTFRTLSLAG